MVNNKCNGLFAGRQVENKLSFTIATWSVEKQSENGFVSFWRHGGKCVGGFVLASGSLEEMAPHLHGNPKDKSSLMRLHR